MTNDELIAAASALTVIKDSRNGCVSGSVGVVIQSKSGRIYKGVSIDCTCGIGFCGEHSAIAAMLTEGESQIDLIVAINSHSKIYTPCGRCRELMFQVNRDNLNAKIILAKGRTITLGELLPMPWQEGG